MKKLFLISAMILSLGSMSTCFASKTLDSTTTEGTMNITYGVEAGYVVTIPSAVNFAEAYEPEEIEIMASEVMINYGKKLVVKVASPNYDEINRPEGIGEGWDDFDYTGWWLVEKNTQATSLMYSIKTEDSTPVVNNGVVLSVDAGNKTGEASLVFQLEEEPTSSGQYKDTLTFTVEVQ